MIDCYYCIHGDTDAHGVFHCELGVEPYHVVEWNGKCRHFEFDTGDDDDE